ncbi:MAG: phosphate butyryltransferase [bacterium]|nr:phosphate butyryltransferase [bacterium]
MITSFAALLDKVKLAPSKRVAVAGADSVTVIESLSEAQKQNLIEPVLVGKAGDIVRFADKCGRDISAMRIVDIDGDESAVSSAAVAEVVEDRADLLMKGSVSTEKLLKAVLDREHGLRTGRVLSHVAVVEIDTYHKLMLHTDGGINLHQNLATRKDILTNAVELARCLENNHPFVAGLALVEKENPKLPETLDMSELMVWAGGGPLGNLFIEGPIGMDMAYSRDAAYLKGITSRVAGQVDIFLHPNVSAANFVVKSLIQLADAQVAGIVVGARVPIVLLSRSDSTHIRMLSLALGALHDEKEIESRKHRPFFG